MFHFIFKNLKYISKNIPKRLRWDGTVECWTFIRGSKVTLRVDVPSIIRQLYEAKASENPATFEPLFFYPSVTAEEGVDLTSLDFQHVKALVHRNLLPAGINEGEFKPAIEVGCDEKGLYIALMPRKLRDERWNASVRTAPRQQSSHAA